MFISEIINGYQYTCGNVYFIIIAVVLKLLFICYFASLSWTPLPLLI